MTHQVVSAALLRHSAKTSTAFYDSLWKSGAQGLLHQPVISYIGLNRMPYLPKERHGQSNHGMEMEESPVDMEDYDDGHDVVPTVYKQLNKFDTFAFETRGRNPESRSESSSSLSTVPMDSSPVTDSRPGTPSINYGVPSAGQQQSRNKGKGRASGADAITAVRAQFAGQRYEEDDEMICIICKEAGTVPLLQCGCFRLCSGCARGRGGNAHLPCPVHG